MGERRYTLRNGGLMAMLVGAALVLGLNGSASGAEVIEAEVSIVPEHLYRHQHFEFVITIRTRDARLGTQINIGGLFEDERVVQVKPFRERAPEKSMEGLARLETRRFVGVARIDGVGAFIFRPILNLQKIERRRTRMGYQWTERPVRVAAPSLSVRVLPLPSGAPSAFSGAVGQFAFNAEPSSREVEVGDLVRLRVRIDGEGYRDTMQKPQVTAEEAPAFSVYDPIVVPDSSSSALVYEQILVPRHQQANMIPALAFTYFDPERERYLTETRGPFPLVFKARLAEEPDTLFWPETEDEPLVKPVDDVGQTLTFGAWLVARWRNGRLRVRGWERATTRHGVSARLAPAPTALATFAVPDKATLTVIESHQGWIKIEYRGNRGWIPNDAVERTRAARRLRGRGPQGISPIISARIGNSLAPFSPRIGSTNWGQA